MSTGEQAEIPKSPEKLVEDAKKQQIKDILSMKYKLAISRAIRVMVYVCIILLALISVIFK